MEELICPKCGDPMEEGELEGVPLDRCTGCKGMWIDHTSLEHILQKKVAGQHPAGSRYEYMDWGGDPETDMPCPRCTSWLAQHSHKAVLIEWCRSCRGVYLDSEELESMTAWRREAVENNREGSLLGTAAGEIGGFLLFDFLFDLFD